MIKPNGSQRLVAGDPQISKIHNLATHLQGDFYFGKFDMVII